MALVVLAHSLSTMMVFDRGAKGFVGGQLTMYGLAAAEKFEQQGTAATDDYLALVERTTRVRAFLFDENGRQLAGGVPTAKAQELIRKATEGGEENFNQTARMDYLAKWVETPSGKRFIIASESGRPTGVHLPFWPGVWWAQLIAVLLTTGLLCYLLARYLTSPIVKLRAATQRLTAGDLRARVGIGLGKRRDELADLGRDFDNMAERIQNLLDSERRLLHDISHELRSPLTRQKIALELARESEGEESEWALERIEREADRLEGLINQLLTLARLESNSPVVNKEPIHLQQLLDEIVFDANFEASNRNRTVRVKTSQDYVVAGNRRLLYSAIENVVRNAIAYTAEGTEVEISVENKGKTAGEEGSEVIIRVLDHGAGVPQVALANLFHPFYRVAEARDRQSGGIGLGLSISQRAIHLHGGTIAASNTSEGGLLVEICLPTRNNHKDRKRN